AFAVANRAGASSAPPRAFAIGTDLGRFHSKGARGPRIGFGERNLDRLLDIGAAPRAEFRRRGASARIGACRATTAEERIEEIRESSRIVVELVAGGATSAPRGAVGAVGARARRACGGAELLLPVWAQRVVLMTLLRVGEDIVRFVDFLELGLGGLIAWIDVR